MNQKYLLVLPCTATTTTNTATAATGAHAPAPTSVTPVPRNVIHYAERDNPHSGNLLLVLFPVK
jgi:hypothetical protein